MSEVRVTSISEIKNMAGAKVVELPGWAPDESIYVKLKRPSILTMSSKGLLPNSLLSAAQQVFTGEQSSKGKSVSMKDLGNLMDIMVEEAMVEPTFAELKEAGVELTDEQVTEIFNYTQRGVTQLSTFREEQERAEGDNGSEAV